MDEKELETVERDLEDVAELLALTYNQSDERSKSDIPSAIESTNCRCCPSYRIRRIRNNGAYLALFINALVDITYYGALGHVFQHLVHDISPVGLSTFVRLVFVQSIPQLLYPLAGWLADTHFGRYKTIRASLWLLWGGFVALFITFCIHSRHGDGGFHIFAYYVVFPIIFVTVNIGLAGFQANIIPFGIDQMPTGSAEQLSAFVHWYYWSRNIGGGLILTFLICIAKDDVVVIVQSLVEAVCISIALLSWYLLKKWLIAEPHSYNPFHTVYRVLKFASEHKSPIYRSSLTYWEDELPSRVDLAKDKFGGPFSTEHVEDVKTFLRISAILASLGGFLFIYDSAVGSLFTDHLKDHALSSSCSIGDVLLSQLDTLPIILCIPIYEFMIYPLFYKYIPTMLRRVGIGMIVAIAATVCFLAYDIHGHLQQHAMYSNSTENRNETELECFLVQSSPDSNTVHLDLSSGLVALPYTLSAIAEMLVFIAVLEFICAQSPYNMRGMLIGVYYGVRGLFAFFSGILILAFSMGYHPNPTFSKPTCGSLYYSLTIFFAVLGLVIYYRVAKGYKKRQRDDSDTLVNQHAFVEEYYGAIN